MKKFTETMKSDADNPLCTDNFLRYIGKEDNCCYQISYSPTEKENLGDNYSHKVAVYQDMKSQSYIEVYVIKEVPFHDNSSMFNPAKYSIKVNVIYIANDKSEIPNILKKIKKYLSSD